jgi:hypothetical protein
MYLLIYVEWVDMGDYDYKPSVRLPRELGLRANSL